MLKKGVSLRGLEVFEALAGSGSVAKTAELTGLSQPAVSQQVRNLEAALGIDLVDHGRRPMQLTSAGRSFLARTKTVLSQLRLAQNELTVMDLSHLSTLSLGMIDDFDNDLTPRLVTMLAENMSRCHFRLMSAPSLEITGAIKSGKLHMAVAASSSEALDGVVEYPLAKDPFILVVRRGAVDDFASVEAMTRKLPFLRYDRNQLIGRQVDSLLARAGKAYTERFEIGAHQALMTLAARGVGWAITTPFGYMRAERFHDDIEAHPLPFAASARTISLFAGSDWTDSTPQDVANTVRGLMRDLIVEPACRQLPWLEGELTVLSA